VAARHSGRRPMRNPAGTQLRAAQITATSASQPRAGTTELSWRRSCSGLEL